MQPLFDGETFSPVLDGPRLTSQLESVKALMADEQWRTLAEIARAVRGTEASVSARLRDLRKPRFGRHQVLRQRVVKGLHAYKVLPPALVNRLF